MPYFYKNFAHFFTKKTAKNEQKKLINVIRIKNKFIVFD